MPRVNDPTHCVDCNEPLNRLDDDGRPLTTLVGYGQTPEGNKVCYACCGKRDEAHMRETGRIVLYLSTDFVPEKGFPYSERWHVGNWPASLLFWCGKPKRGRHNIAGSRYDVWFDGPDGYVWWGVQYGEDSQLTYCKRTKEKSHDGSKSHNREERRAG